jgi:murein DD-endopeptidase MepM/ murein hydrolase activator NlpD
MRPNIGSAILLLLLGLPTLASARLELDCPETVPEGRAFAITIRGEAPVDSLNVEWLERTLRPARSVDGPGWSARAILGLGMKERLSGESWILRVSAWRGGMAEILLREIHRVDRDYPEQHLDVARKFTELSKTDLARHERERAATRAVLARVTSPPEWPLPLDRPVAGRVTSDFGLRRFFNGEAKKPHSGVDLAGARGTPVLACADGVVTLADDHFFSGRSVYVDHGAGVQSMYFHFTEIHVEPGQLVKRGEMLGTVGDSGRVTGPHLHWGLSVLGQLVDPLPLVK